MTHLTPGAKALLDGKRIVTMLGMPYQGLVGIQSLPPHEGWYQIEVGIERLTPLLTAVVQEDGTVKEPNPLGEKPPHGIIMETDECAAWCAAESQRRTFHALHIDNARFVTQMYPGTTVLGYEKDGKFIIVETVGK